MKAIIIAAGEGSRLLPLTLTTPKCLVEVGGCPILDHQIDVVKSAGIDAAVVIGGYRIEQVADHIAAHDFGIAVELVFNPFWAAASSIGSVWAAREHLTGAFALMNGDTLFDPVIVASAVGDLATGVKLVVDAIDRPELDDMLVEVADGKVRDVGKDLDASRATHRSLGMIISTGSNAYASALRDVIGGEDGIHAYHHAVIARLARSAGVTAVAIDRQAHWQEIDRPEDIQRWQRDHRATVRA